MNSQLYSFPEDAWKDPKVVAQFKDVVNKLDLKQHPRLPVGSRLENGGQAQPDGLVYEDVYEVILRLFRVSYMRSHGFGLHGAKQTPEQISADRALVTELMGTLKRFVPFDPSLAQHIVSFQKGLQAEVERLKSEGEPPGPIEPPKTEEEAERTGETVKKTALKLLHAKLAARPSPARKWREVAVPPLQAEAVEEYTAFSALGPQVTETSPEAWAGLRSFSETKALETKSQILQARLE